MRFPVIENLQGIANGVNTIFRTSAPYKTGSVRIFRNGLMGKSPLVDGWVELGGDRLQIKEPPIQGDILQVYYLPQ